MTDLLELVGAHNPIGLEPVKSRPVSDDEVAYLNPDAIVLSWYGDRPEKVRPEVVARNPAWQQVEAVKRGRIYCVPEAFLGRPGPRLVAGYRALAEITRGFG